VKIEQFTTLLINSRLFSELEAQELASVFQESCRKWNTPDTVDSFCDFLIATNRLTAWQCNKLRMGKWKGFYLDNYLILEQIGKDHEFCYYKARNARDGTLVRMVVTPMARATRPGIEYRIEPYSK
jgi:hypothetical protein